MGRGGGCKGVLVFRWRRIECLSLPSAEEKEYTETNGRKTYKPANNSAGYVANANGEFGIARSGG